MVIEKIGMSFTIIASVILAVISKEYSELKDKLKVAHQENYELKKKLNELLTKIDQIQKFKEKKVINNEK